MHRYSVARFVTSLCVAAALGGCALMSKNPVGPESAAVKDEALWGDWIWEGKDGDVSILHVLPHKGGDGKVLDIVFAGGKGEDNGWYVLKGHATAITGDKRYLNLQLVATAPEMVADLDKSYPDRADYPYAYVPYKHIDVEHLEVGGIPAEIMHDAIKQGALEGKLEGDGSFDVAKVSASSDKIAAYLATQDDEKLFKDAMLFTRVHPPM